jgi:small subunit ribosomal protein S15
MSSVQSSVNHGEKSVSILQSLGIEASNTGSSEFQIISLTKKITELSEHSKKHFKDHSSKRSLLVMINKRKSLMRYLQARNPKSLLALTEKLGVRNTAL